jgi:T-complex protein 1 subunit zeta
MSVKTLNPRAETMGQTAALFMNINAAKGLLDVMKTNFGPKGTIKMLVSGAGGETERGSGGGSVRRRRRPPHRACLCTRAARKNNTKLNAHHPHQNQKNRHQAHQGRQRPLA